MSNPTKVIIDVENSCAVQVDIHGRVIMSPEVAKKIELLEKAVIELVEMGEEANYKFHDINGFYKKMGFDKKFTPWEIAKKGISDSNETLQSPTVKEAIKLARQNDDE